MSDYIELGSVAEFVSDRIDMERVNKQNYISTENMIEKKGGILGANSLPTSKTVLNYKPKDILISNIRLYFEKIWFADKEGGSSADVLVLRAKKGYSPKFIYYALSDSNFFKYADVTSKGTKMPRGDKKAILKYTIPDYPVYYQTKIADVLSTYDKLIENNNRRIQILEQTAEELYKEWFVRMRFPGYEKTKFDKGIPEGWEVKKIKDVIDKLESGRRPKSIKVTSSKETVVSLGAGDIKGLGEYSYSNEYLVPLSFYQSLNRGKIKDKDIAIYKDGAYTGKVTMFRDNFPYEKMAINEHVFLVKCKEEIMQNYLLFTLKQSSYYELMQALSMTSAQPGLNQTNFKNIKIQIPNNPLLIMFHEKTEYFLKEIFNLAKQNQTLIKQRDLLIPRLMNGTITVK